MGRQLKKNARQAAFDILGRVFGGGAYADIILQKELNGLTVKDRPLATEIVYGILRWQIRIDFIIDAFSSIKTRKLEHGVLNSMRIGVYQLLFLSGVPSSAAVNESVNLIKSGSKGVTPSKGAAPGAKKAGFVNAVLRRIDREREAIVFPDTKTDPQRHISVVYSHPEWMIRRWTARYGIDAAARLCNANQTRPGKTVRANTVIISRDNLIKALEEAGFKVLKTVFSPDGIEVTEAPASKTLDPVDPRFYIQDEASQLIARLVCPEPGETVLDACAAPGGKTTHMAALMGNSGMILAMDKYPGRVKSIIEAAGRLQAHIIRPLAADAGRPLPFSSSPLAGVEPLQVEGRVGVRLFDAILLDAPCSGLGVLGRSPDIKIKRKEADIAALSKTQQAVIANLSSYVRKGGRMVYSVCTLEPEETDEVISAFLKTHPDFSLENASIILPPSCAPLVDKDGFLRTMPHLHNMDGFFAARLKRGG
ncbi:MAG: 16S rRNA (cytosine(967)-C(5))-methyltransferase RsmB [Deltaproteobacteria bacterium]|nr:16S rRNA (cytosine(967)-C(5))-methyltransferase RsmB [Deltaproteobacteria bacterium]